MNQQTIQYLSLEEDTILLRMKGRYNFAHIPAVEKEIEFVTSVYHTKKILVDFSETKILTVAAWRSLKKIREIFGEENFACIHANKQIQYLLSVVNADGCITETEEETNDGKETGEHEFRSDDGTFSQGGFDKGEEKRA